VDFRVPPVLQFKEALLFWAVFLWVFIPEGRLLRKTAPPTSQDGGTMRLIVVGNQAAMFLAAAASFLPRFATPGPRVGLLLGTGLLCAGGVLRRLCFRALGQYFTGAVTVSPDQPVVDRGPYRFVRHPSYTAGFLVFLGFGVALGSWLSIAFLFLLPAYVYRRRVLVEEAALLGTIGEPYRAYMSRTRRFIPFLL
jgi:protein-S-isoprenylcysteine O-methyltransferase